jgi:hypothetical protein
MNVEQSRRNIRAVSALHYFVSFLWLAAGAGSALILAQGGALTWRPAIGIAFILSIGVFEFVLARALRRFQPWSRKAGIVVSILGLFAFPVGTVIGAASLYVFFKGIWPAPDALSPEQSTSIPS